jgi:SIR2-like protein
MKKRVVIIGAGFSKALADAPLVNEFVGPIYRSAINKELSKRVGVSNYEDSFLKIIEYLKNSVEHGLKFLEKPETKIENRSGENLISSLNIEYLCTLIDLNIERPFIPKGIGVDLQGCPIPFMDEMFVHDFEDAKSFVLNYIIQMLLPTSLKIKNDYCDKFAEFIKPGDVILTFNYDILIEQILWKARKWNPTDGYKLGKIDDYLSIEPESIFKSTNPILKLHGSINWREPGFFDDDISIYITHPLNQDTFFPELKFKTKVKRITDRNMFNSFLIFPTFIKNFKSKFELYLISTAIDYIKNCNEIVTLGYSFPESDSLTTFIITQIPNRVKLKIIDINADKIRENLIKTFGLDSNRIIHEKSDICSWIENDFNFSEFENYVKEQKEIDEILGLNKKNPGDDKIFYKFVNLIYQFILSIWRKIRFW